jgi:hypothetical protein
MKTQNKIVTRFMDMHSGGHLKTPYTHIYIDEPLGEAVKTFKNLFKRDPDNITCKCCGEDFVYEQYDSLEEATAYDRKCDWVDGKYNENGKMSVEDYFSGENKVIFITE